MHSIYPARAGVRHNDDGSYTLCSKNGCCPSVMFHDDGAATITDEGQTIRFSRERLSTLARLPGFGSHTLRGENGGCTISFHEDGSAAITDEGQTIRFSPEQALMLMRLLSVRQ